MHRSRWRTLLITLGLICSCSPDYAQSDQFLPEVDFYSSVRDGVQFQFQAQQTREANVPVQAQIGPSLNFYVHPLARLVDITKFDLDDTKARVLVLSVGYRYLPGSSGAPETNRIVPVATFQFPFTARLVLSDRNRFELDWKNASFAWRYRNRFQVEGPVGIGSYHLTPYASVEPFYQSEYGKWSNTAIYIGCFFPIKKHVQLDPYYAHQNETGKKPNNQLNQFGFVVNLYF